MRKQLPEKKPAGRLTQILPETDISVLTQRGLNQSQK